MNYKLILLAGMALWVIACDQKSDLEQKREALKELRAEIAKLEQKASILEEEIGKDDSAEEGTVVELATMQPGPFRHYVRVHGVVEASKNILANPEVSGRITDLRVKEGQKVNKGQTIAAIDASILERNIQEVKKNLEFAETLFKKQKTLHEKGVGTEVQYLEAKNRKESLEKTLSTLYSQLEKYEIKAPITGYIDELMPKEGEMVGPQMPIARLVNLDKVFVEADVSEALLGKIGEGDQVDVDFTNLNKIVRGKIVQTGQYINPQNRTFKVKIDLEEQNHLFKPNLLTIVRLVDYRKDSTLVVPTTVVQDDLKGTYVFTAEQGKAVKKYVEVGVSNTDKTEILSGLEGGETIITRGHRGLVNGETVRSYTKG